MNASRKRPDQLTPDQRKALDQRIAREGRQRAAAQRERLAEHMRLDAVRELHFWLRCAQRDVSRCSGARRTALRAQVVELEAAALALGWVPLRPGSAELRRA